MLKGRADHLPKPSLSSSTLFLLEANLLGTQSVLRQRISIYAEMKCPWPGCTYLGNGASAFFHQRACKFRVSSVSRDALIRKNVRYAVKMRRLPQRLGGCLSRVPTENIGVSKEDVYEWEQTDLVEAVQGYAKNADAKGLMDKKLAQVTRVPKSS